MRGGALWEVPLPLLLVSVAALRSRLMETMPPHPSLGLERPMRLLVDRAVLGGPEEGGVVFGFGQLYQGLFIKGH